MVYCYKCIKSKGMDFTAGQIYILDPEKKEFLGNCDVNFYYTVTDKNGNPILDPEVWDFTTAEFVAEAVLVNPSNSKVVIKRKGNKVIAKCGNRVAEAKCHENDEFDYYTSYRLALDRLFGKEEKNNTAKNNKNEDDRFDLKKGDIVKVTEPGLAYSTWLDFFKKLSDFGYSGAYIKDLTERYSYGLGLGYEIYKVDEETYNKIYRDRRYKVEFANKTLRTIVITYGNDNSVYLIDYHGVEKV